MPPGQRASFGCFGRSKLPFLAPLRDASGTGTLEGPQQPNWCQLFLAPAIADLGNRKEELTIRVSFFRPKAGW
ncbi:MAG: hypothetical protein M3Q05_00735 [Bacteroidota bacterium]|nr:hypothetical protein [Bacteroidota bacterium]